MKDIKIIIFLLLIIMFLPVISASAVDSDFDYYIADGKIILTQYVGNETKVTVPSKINGYCVIATEGTFANNQSIKEVIFNNGISVIGQNTFLNCRNLEKVTIPSTVTRLDAYAFAHTSIERLVLPKSTTFIGIGCFSGCEKLYFIHAPADDLYIGQLAMENSSLKIMQVKQVPFFYDNTFTSDCKFALNSLTAFIMQLDYIYPFLKWCNDQSIAIRALLIIFLAFSVLVLIVLITTLSKIIRIGLKKDNLTNYKIFEKACLDCLQANDGPSYLFYHERIGLLEHLKSACLLIGVSFVFVLYLYGWILLGICSYNLLDTYSTILLIMWMIGTFIIYNLILWLAVKTGYKAYSYIVEKCDYTTKIRIRAKKLTKG